MRQATLMLDMLRFIEIVHISLPREKPAKITRAIIYMDKIQKNTSLVDYS